MFDPGKIIAAFNRHRVSHIVIGGIAAALHGCPEQTYDLDVLYADTTENRRRLLLALDDIGAKWDVPLSDEVLRRQPVFALNTQFGDLDIMTWIPGIEDFEKAIPRTQIFQLGDETIRALDLASLIDAKAAAADPNPRKQSTLQYLKELQRLKAGTE